jgi:hypothetical protein
MNKEIHHLCVCILNFTTLFEVILPSRSHDLQDHKFIGLDELCGNESDTLTAMRA